MGTCLAVPVFAVYFCCPCPGSDLARLQQAAQAVLFIVATVIALSYPVCLYRIPVGVLPLFLPVLTGLTFCDAFSDGFFSLVGWRLGLFYFVATVVYCVLLFFYASFSPAALTQAENEVEAGWYAIDCAAKGGPGNITVPAAHINFVLGVGWRVVQENYTTFPQPVGGGTPSFSFVAPIAYEESGGCQTKDPLFAACVSSQNDTELCLWGTMTGQSNMRLLTASSVSGDAYWGKSVPDPQDPNSDVELTKHNVFQYNSISHEETVDIVERERSGVRRRRLLFCMGWMGAISPGAAIAALLVVRRDRRERAEERRAERQRSFRKNQGAAALADSTREGDLEPLIEMQPLPHETLTLSEPVADDARGAATLPLS